MNNPLDFAKNATGIFSEIERRVSLNPLSPDLKVGAIDCYNIYESFIKMISYKLSTTISIKVKLACPMSSGRISRKSIVYQTVAIGS
jgi:hypothetical protein